MRTGLAKYLVLLTQATEGLEDVRVVPSIRNLGEFNKPTIVVKTDTLTKLPAAPKSNLGSFTVTLISPHDDMDRAEDQLDDLLELFLPQLFTWQLNWESASQASYNDKLCYDIVVTSIMTPENEEEDNG
jgi:hypothetical protein